MLLFSEISHRVSADVLKVIRIAAAFYYLAVESMDRFLGEKVLSDVKNISTLVAVFRELERFVLEFVAACLNADGKVMNLVAGFWLGTLLLCLSPAARGRASFDHPSIWETFLLIIGELRAFYVLLFLLVYTFFREKRNNNNHTLRKFFYDNQLYFYVILIELVFSLVIGFRNVRQLFGIELFSVVILIKLISEQTSFNAVWCRSVSIVAASAIVLHMAFVIPCAKRSHAQFQDIVTTYLHSEDGVVSFRYEEFPCWVDSYVWRFGGYADWEAFCISVYYMGDRKPMKALLVD